MHDIRAVRADHPDYTYKEAALNPTNPADRALDWEADFINNFRNTYVAHQEQELTDANLAEKNLKQWILGLRRISEP